MHGVEPICRALTEAGAKIAPSTYYAAKTRPPSARAVADAVLDERILATHAAVPSLDVHGAVCPCHGQATRERQTRSLAGFVSHNESGGRG